MAMPNACGETNNIKDGNATSDVGDLTTSVRSYDNVETPDSFRLQNQTIFNRHRTSFSQRTRPLSDSFPKDPEQELQRL
jgi:hypothetical protein